MNRYVLSLIRLHKRRLIVYTASEIIISILDYFKLSLGTQKLQEIINLAQQRNEFRLLTFVYCSKAEYYFHLIDMMLELLFAELAVTFTILFFEHICDVSRLHFTSEYRSDLLALMIYHHINLPMTERAKNDIAQYFEVATDSTEFWISCGKDIVAPIVTLIFNICRSNFIYPWYSLVVPILPSILTNKTMVSFAELRKRSFAQIRKEKAQSQNFISNLDQRKLLVKSYNSLPFELAQLRKMLERWNCNQLRATCVKKLSFVLNELLKKFDAYSKAGFEVYFIMFKQFSFAEAGDYAMTVKYLNTLLQDILLYKKKSEEFDYSTAFISSVFSYQIETKRLTSYGMIKDYLHEAQPEHNTLRVKNVQVENLSCALQNKLILNNINFDFEKGFYLIKGQSGKGKSTFFKVLNGIYNDIGGELLFDKQRREIMEKRGMVTIVNEQDYIIPYLSQQENITYGLQYDENKFELACEISHIDFYNDNVAVLSGGQEERLALARGIYRVSEEELLLLDESTNSLDNQLEGEILEGLCRYCEQKNIICIMISHRSTVEQYAKSIIDFDAISE